MTSPFIYGKIASASTFTDREQETDALVKLDIIDNFGKTVTMEDPIYAFWLKEVYFKNTS